MILADNCKGLTYPYWNTKRRREGRKVIFEITMMDDIPKLTADTKPQIQEAHRTPSRRKTKRKERKGGREGGRKKNTSTHIIPKS